MDMQIPIEQLDPDYLMYGGVIGILLGLLFFIYFLYRRIRWIILALRRRGTDSPGLLSSLRNLILIVLWTSVFGMVLFLGFFLRSYYAFTYEEPVAEVVIQSSDAPTLAKHGIDKLKLGDIVAITDHDASYGWCYRKGAVTIGLIIHGASQLSAHGPGVTTLMTCRSGRIIPVPDANANVGRYLKLGRYRK